MSMRFHTRPAAALALVMMLVPLTVAAAQQRATAEQAQELVARAITLYDRVGRDAAFAAFEDADGDFVDHDLYVFVFGPEHTIVAHGGDPELVGTPTADLVDVDGVRFAERFMAEATPDGVWIGYKWRDPVTGEVLPKSSWVVLHDGYVFGAGIYAPSRSR